MATEFPKTNASATVESIQVEGLEDALGIANERKTEGNDFFRQTLWSEALTAYQSALNVLPKRTTKSNETEDLTSSDDEGKISEIVDNGKAKDSTDSGSQLDEPPEEGKQEVPVSTSPSSVSPEDPRCSKLRAILNANIGACFVKLGDHKSAVESCSQALLDDPEYVKALERRAASNDALDTWSSLTAAQEDYGKLLKLVSSPAQVADLERKMRILKPRLDIAQKKETEEMMSKLKGLGNSLLGTFGLSTDNFKFEPNGQGGYSVNFAR